MTYFIESLSHLHRSYALLVLQIVNFAAQSHFHLRLLLWLLESKLLTYVGSVAVLAEVFQFVLRPDLFVDALRPSLIVVVVAYHFT